ncbi:MAG: transferrin receptor-like dimerization domain-containing protein [Pyrinomonadaceae bacterium]
MLRNLSRGLIAPLIVFSFVLQPLAQSSGPLMGFANDSAAAERSAEVKFDSYLNAHDLTEWQKRLSARPHHLGSAYDKDNAEFIAAQFRSWGYDTQIESFDVLFPTPKTRLVEMTAPERYRMKLQEPAIPSDPTSDQQSEQLPTYNAYSIDGDVTGPLVYVNYGRPQDYDVLAEAGIDVRGKIAISRYGGSWRGIKPKVAAEHGAIGCIIYSDPKDDGYYQGDVYPKGAYRNENGVQRGSVMDMPLYPGDPLTKGIGATKNAPRIPIKSAPTLTKIPVLPVSYGDALPLLRNLDGAVVPDAWRGALPATYHFGGKTPTVHMKLEFNWDMKTINDVIAKMPGSERPDEWIIRGNHEDGWVNGAEDPLSGQVAMMAEAKAMAQLSKSGWKPKRTIVFCAWDAEEEGLIGSTEWVETHAEELAQKGAVYINTDTNGRGFLGMEGSHTLEKFINEVGKDIPDPETKMSVWERARANRTVNASPQTRKEIMERPDLRISALGSGSDYTPFIQHLGIASMNIGFGGEDGGGSYHSIYDSFAHFQRFIDPGNIYGVAMSKVCGHAVMRLADADTLPFEFTDFADTVGTYVNEVTKLTDNMRDETNSMNEMVQNGTWQAVQDPTETHIAPRQKDAVPNIDFTPLRKALDRVNDAARKYQNASKGHLPSADRQKALDEILIKTERDLTSSEGLPRRDWFRHQIYAPGFYTGYGVKTLPGVREAIEQRNWTEAQAEIQIIAATLDRFAAEVDRAAKMY